MAHAASAAPPRPPLLDPKRLRSAAVSVGLFVAVLAALWALWEAFKAVGEATDLRLGQFEPNDRTMPHVHDIVGTLFEPSRRNGPLLIDILWDAALFTAKEAAVGFALGALVGFALGAALAHSGLLQRGFLPYIIASQTIPILAVAPMVVVWVNPRLPASLKDWGAVAVIAAYLPNEADTVVDTLRAFLDQEYAGGLQVVLAYNTPRPLRVEAELEAMADGNPDLTLLKVDDSTSKAQNVNAALRVVEGEFVGIFDADHHPMPGAFERAWHGDRALLTLDRL